MLMTNWTKRFGYKLYGYTPREPVVLPSKSINRPLKVDCHNGTTYNRLDIVGHEMVN